MISLKKILVPTDFSEHGAKAVVYATELAASFGSEIHLLHVVEHAPISYGEGGAVMPETLSEMKANSAKQLDEVEVNSTADLQVIRSVVEGRPFLEIIRYAKEHSIDLIVTGTHGRGAIAHMLLGSVAERVVRKAPCPVLVVRDEEHEFVMP